MERRRREFLRTMSTAAVLPVLAPTLKTAAETGSVEDSTNFPTAASLDFPSAFPAAEGICQRSAWLMLYGLMPAAPA
ncbi:MAG TPA: hypothetical protein VN749_20090 [Candidatus Eisenbacteria bacterium]|jgi:hypothetical protein|nr:hypothetical protein [Candidatus Eisenbacteria bacterium]